MKPCKLPCPKCGSEDIYRKYYKQGENTAESSLNNERLQTSEYVNRTNHFNHPAKKECIVHHCRCCQYSWDTGIVNNNKDLELSGAKGRPDSGT